MSLLLFLAVAFIVALLTSIFVFKAKADRIKVQGNIGKWLKWYYESKGQVALFFAVFFAIIVAYVSLRFLPG